VDKKAQVSVCQVYDKEVDLILLVLILLKRKFLILGFVLLCLFAGCFYVLLGSKTYRYTTTLQIGTVLVEGNGSVERASIETVPSVKLKLEQVYVPMAINQLLARYDGRSVSAVVKEQKNSDILLIESRGKLGDGKLFNELHTMIVATLIANHREAISVLKKQYEISVDRANIILDDLEDPKIFGLEEKLFMGAVKTAQMELTGFDDQKLLLLAEKTGLEKIKKLLRGQISRIDENLKLSYEKRDKAISEANDASKAMTFLLLNSDILKNEQQLAMLRERLYVNLENEKQKFESQLAKNQRARELQVTKIDELKSQLMQLQAKRLSEQKKQRNTIAAAKNKINLYRDTKALNFAIRSIRSFGLKKSLVLSLAGLLGLMGGVILALLIEFLAKVRQQRVRIDET